jgi:hypothetical protein
MSSNRQTIRGREVMTLSSECLDRDHGDRENPDCSCPCHSQDEDQDEDEQESP